MRQNQPVGGIFHINLLQLPPQPKTINNWTIRLLQSPAQLHFVDYVATTTQYLPVGITLAGPMAQTLNFALGMTQMSNTLGKLIFCSLFVLTFGVAKLKKGEDYIRNQPGLFPLLGLLPREHLGPAKPKKKVIQIDPLELEYQRLMEEQQKMQQESEQVQNKGSGFLAENGPSVADLSTTRTDGNQKKESLPARDAQNNEAEAEAENDNDEEEEEDEGKHEDDDDEDDVKEDEDEIEIVQGVDDTEKLYAEETLNAKRPSFLGDLLEQPVALVKDIVLTPQNEDETAYKQHERQPRAGGRRISKKQSSKVITVPPGAMELPEAKEAKEEKKKKAVKKSKKKKTSKRKKEKKIVMEDSKKKHVVTPS